MGIPNWAKMLHKIFTVTVLLVLITSKRIELAGSRGNTSLLLAGIGLGGRRLGRCGIVLEERIFHLHLTCLQCKQNDSCNISGSRWILRFKASTWPSFIQIRRRERSIRSIKGSKDIAEHVSCEEYDINRVLIQYTTNALLPLSLT